MSPTARSTNRRTRTRRGPTYRPRRCSLCHETGHDRRSCPTNYNLEPSIERIKMKLIELQCIALIDYLQHKWLYDNRIMESWNNRDKELRSSIVLDKLREYRNTPVQGILLLIYDIIDEDLNEHNIKISREQYIAKFLEITNTSIWQYGDYVLLNHVTSSHSALDSKIGLVDHVKYLSYTVNRESLCELFQFTAFNLDIQYRINQYYTLQNTAVNSVRNFAEYTERELQQQYERRRAHLERQLQELENEYLENTETTAYRVERANQEVETIFDNFPLPDTGFNTNTSNVQFKTKKLTSICNECPICMETKESIEIIETGCKHQLCGSCLLTIVHNNQKKDDTTTPCPMCRGAIQEIHGNPCHLRETIRILKTKSRFPMSLDNLISGLEENNNNPCIIDLTST